MTDDTTSRDVTIALAGEGAATDQWARSLRGIEDVTVHRPTAGADQTFTDKLAPETDGAVLVTPVPDLQGAIKRAIVAGRHVLVAGPVGLNAQYLAAVDVQARARRKLLIFDTGSLADDRLAFTRRMTGGRQPIWRPRYVRSLRTGRPGDNVTIDELAIAEIHVVLGLLSRTPVSVSAVAPRNDDESGAADVAMLTLLFEDGLVARIDISLIEPTPRHEVTVACDGRSIVLNAFDARAPLQIHAAGRHGGPERGSQWAETILEHPIATPEADTARAAAAFIAAIRAEDAAATNATELALAARVWERARTSIARWGEPLPLQDETLVERAPSLRLIHGRGRSVERRRSPYLTVIGSERNEPRTSA